MPDASAAVVVDDMNYAAAVHQIEVKDWLMWYRLNAAGLHCNRRYEMDIEEKKADEVDASRCQLRSHESVESDMFKLDL